MYDIQYFVRLCSEYGKVKSTGRSYQKLKQQSLLKPNVWYLDQNLLTTSIITTLSELTCGIKLDKQQSTHD